MEKQSAVYEALKARGLHAEMMNYDTEVGVACVERRVAVKSPQMGEADYATFWRRPAVQIADDMAEALATARRPTGSGPA